VKESERKCLILVIEVGNKVVKISLFLHQNVSNVASLNAILKCFELDLGLKVNFMKSNLISIHLEEIEVLRLTTILNSRMMDISFLYLGLLVGLDARKVST